MQPLNPLAVGGVGLLVPAGHARQLPCVYQKHRQTLRFQYFVRSNPVDSRAFHRHGLDLARLKPLRQAD